MKLTDLNPKLLGTLGSGVLRFDCPLGHAHKIRVPVNASGTAPGWKATGEFPATVSLTPSINAHEGEPQKADDPNNRECGWHGFITNGEVTNA